MTPLSSLEYWKFYPEKEKEIKLSLLVYSVIVHKKMLQSANEPNCKIQNQLTKTVP